MHRRTKKDLYTLGIIPRKMNNKVNNKMQHFWCVRCTWNTNDRGTVSLMQSNECVGSGSERKCLSLLNAESKSNISCETKQLYLTWKWCSIASICIDIMAQCRVVSKNVYTSSSVLNFLYASNCLVHFPFIRLSSAFISFAIDYKHRLLIDQIDGLF